MFIYPKKRLTEFFLFCVSIIFITKICNGFSMPRESSKKNESSTKNNSSVNAKNSSVTRYYRHEPYGPQTYAFGFEINDKATGNRQFRDERRFLNGTVEGSYGYVRPDGRVSVTHYTADSKLGFLSQTQAYDLTSNKSEENVQFDWRAQFRPTKLPEIFMQNAKNEDERGSPKELTENTTKALKTDFNIDVNHIDLTKDLLSPSLWNIVSGQTPLQGVQQDDNKNKQLGFETFEKVIPKEFPLTPFQLPVKLEEKLENMQQEKNNEMTEKLEVETTTTTPITTTQMMPPKSLESNESADDESNADWISKIVKDTRREFLENIPNLL